MLSLSFSPTMLIGLNKDFDMPTDFSVTCHAPPSMFAYPKVGMYKCSVMYCCRVCTNTLSMGNSLVYLYNTH